MKAWKLIYLSLACFILACGKAPPPEPAQRDGTVGQLLDAAPQASDYLIRGDFTLEEWAAATAPRLKNAQANKDTRSPAQHEAAACWGFEDGHRAWRCRGPAPLMGTTGAQPVIPSAWTISAWFFDNANSSGTASDQNNCTSSSTPCATWRCQRRDILGDDHEEVDLGVRPRSSMQPTFRPERRGGRRRTHRSSRAWAKRGSACGKRDSSISPPQALDAAFSAGYPFAGRHRQRCMLGRGR